MIVAECFLAGFPVILTWKGSTIRAHRLTGGRWKQFADWKDSRVTAACAGHGDVGYCATEEGGLWEFSASGTRQLAKLSSKHEYGAIQVASGGSIILGNRGSISVYNPVDASVTTTDYDNFRTTMKRRRAFSARPDGDGVILLGEKGLAVRWSPISGFSQLLVTPAGERMWFGNSAVIGEDLYVSCAIDPKLWRIRDGQIDAIECPPSPIGYSMPCAVYDGDLVVASLGVYRRTAAGWVTLLDEVSADRGVVSLIADPAGEALTVVYADGSAVTITPAGKSPSRIARV